MLRKTQALDKLDNLEDFKFSTNNTSEKHNLTNSVLSDRRQLVNSRSSGSPIKCDQNGLDVVRPPSREKNLMRIDRVLVSESQYMSSASSISSICISLNSSSCHCLSCEDVQKELGIVRKMYMMNLEEDESVDEKTSTNNHEAEDNSNRENHPEWTGQFYGVNASGDANAEHNIILETPVSKDTMNRSGNERLYKLEEEDKKRAKGEKKAKKKKDKNDKKLKKQKTKKKGEEDEIIVANEELIESGNEFPTLPISNNGQEKEAPYFMATSDLIAKEDEVDAIRGRKVDDSIIRQGKHKIPRLARSTRKDDENHLIYRRNGEKEEGDTTESGDDFEVFPDQPQRYPSPAHYQEPYRLQPYFQNVRRPPMPLPPPNLQIQHGTLNRNENAASGGNANIDQAAAFYASIATLKRDRAKGVVHTRGENDGPIFYENPYHAMPSNKNVNRVTLQDERITQDRPVGFEYSGIHPPPPPPPSAIYGSHYAYPPHSKKGKSKASKKSDPPTWKDIRDAYLKSQVSEEDHMRKFSPKRHLEGLALAIGFIGMIVAVSLLLAYVIVQAPQVRRKIGPSFYIPAGESLEFVSNNTSEDILSDSRENRGIELAQDVADAIIDDDENKQADEIEPSPNRRYVIYGVEIGLSIFTGILMITTNALLIHGVRKKFGPFLLPWLVFHAFLVAGLFAAAILIIKFAGPLDAYKAFSVLPGVAGILLILCWIKVYKLRKNFIRQQRRRCGKVEELYATGAASTYTNFGDTIYPASPKIPDPDYSMG